MSKNNTFTVTKTYKELGSTVFRQPKAKSHCSKLHGYALTFSFEFTADELDENGWVVDFGQLKAIKAVLDSKFDHKVAISVSDPHLALFKELEEKGLVDLTILNAVGCEAFAEYMMETANNIIDINENNTHRGVRCIRVTVNESEKNSATVREAI